MGHFMRWRPEGDAVISRWPGGCRPVTMKVRFDGSDPEPLPRGQGRGRHWEDKYDKTKGQRRH